MVRHGKRKESAAVAGLPLYIGHKKKKAPFPVYLKKYHACVASGKSKTFCKKHTPGYPHPK